MAKDICKRKCIDERAYNIYQNNSFFTSPGIGIYTVTSKGVSTDQTRNTEHKIMTLQLNMLNYHDAVLKVLQTKRKREFKERWILVCVFNCCHSDKFADVVHVRNYWILAQAMAHVPIPNFDVP